MILQFDNYAQLLIGFCWNKKPKAIVLAPTKIMYMTMNSMESLNKLLEPCQQRENINLYRAYLYLKNTEFCNLLCRPNIALNALCLGTDYNYNTGDIIYVYKSWFNINLFLSKLKLG